MTAPLDPFAPPEPDESPVMYPCRTAGGPRPGIRFRCVDPIRYGNGYRDYRGEIVMYRCFGEQDADGTYVERPFPPRTLHQRLMDWLWNP